jgi:hypothetical protein
VQTGAPSGSRSWVPRVQPAWHVAGLPPALDRMRPSRRVGPCGRTSDPTHHSYPEGYLTRVTSDWGAPSCGLGRGTSVSQWAVVAASSQTAAVASVALLAPTLAKEGSGQRTTEQEGEQSVGGECVTYPCGQHANGASTEKREP